MKIVKSLFALRTKASRASLFWTFESREKLRDVRRVRKMNERDKCDIWFSRKCYARRKAGDLQLISWENFCDVVKLIELSQFDVRKLKFINSSLDQHFQFATAKNEIIEIFYCELILQNRNYLFPCLCVRFPFIDYFSKDFHFSA